MEREKEEEDSKIQKTKQRIQSMNLGSVLYKVR